MKNLLIGTLSFLLQATIALRMSKFSLNMMSTTTSVTNPTLQASLQILDINPTGLRIFHPAFPLELLNHVNKDQAIQIQRVKDMTVSDSLENTDFSHLPWKTLPFIGLDYKNENKFPSKFQISESFKKSKHLGHFVWAHKSNVPRKGGLLLNHWQQQVIFLTEYDHEKGAKGYVLDQNNKHAYTDMIVWPPLALEMEISDGRWQPVTVSDSVSSTVLEYLPPDMPNAVWEFVFLLLVSYESDPEVMQGLFDTGLSPEKGLIAYLRLLAKIESRAELNNNVPEYRQIIEKEIIL